MQRVQVFPVAFTLAQKQSCIYFDTPGEMERPEGPLPAPFPEGKGVAFTLARCVIILMGFPAPEIMKEGLQRVPYHTRRKKKHQEWSGYWRIDQTDCQSD